MAKAIYICSRKALPATIEKKLHEICTNLAPDNITPVKPKVVVNGNIAYGIMNPTSTISDDGNSLLMGHILDRVDDWNVPLQDFPDGSYAIFRNGGEFCELVSDPVASRTIWYYLDDDKLVASTSQRALIMFLGSFEFDERVIPWMLSTGSLGPGFSWDKRIKKVRPDSSVTLNKSTWTTTEKSNPIEFNLAKRSDEQHEKNLRESLENTFKNLSFDDSKWVLLLSGGYDSRGILCFLLAANPKNHNLRTITWGLKSSLNVKGNDAYVAIELAKKLNMSNKYYVNDLSKEPIDVVIDRFIRVGEGLSDNIPDYLDGFSTWKAIFEDGIEAIIRGDEAFGWYPVNSPSSVRFNVTLNFCSDYSNLKDYEKYGFHKQELQSHFNQKKDETYSTWRDRAFLENMQPVVQAALSDLKLSYVEQFNPYLSRKVLHQVRQLPDQMRTDRALFRKIVTSISPDIDFATVASSASMHYILTREKMAKLMINELTSNTAKNLLPAEFLDLVVKNIKTERKTDTLKPNSFSLKTSILKIVPQFVKRAFRKISLPVLDPNILAFRVLMITKMCATLNNDSRNK